MFNDGEFINQALKLGDQVGADKNGSVFRIGILIGPDDGTDEFASDQRIESRGGFVEDE